MAEETKPRIGNLPRAEWTDEAREVFAFWGHEDARENGSDSNMTMVMANHPKLAIAYNTFGKHLLLTSSIAVRPRELIVLRTAWLQKCEYEWHYHVGYALSAGLTMDEIAAIRDGWQSPTWDGKEEDRVILRAVDGARVGCFQVRPHFVRLAIKTVIEPVIGVFSPHHALAIGNGHLLRSSHAYLAAGRGAGWAVGLAEGGGQRQIDARDDEVVADGALDEAHRRLDRDRE